MLNVIFVLRCRGLSVKATDIARIIECAHGWQQAAELNYFHFITVFKQLIQTMRSEISTILTVRDDSLPWSCE